MTIFTARRLKLAAPLAFALALGACGGGGDGDKFAGFPIVIPPTNPTTPGNPQPPTSMDFVAYVKSLVGATSETDLPVDVAKYDPPPTSETADPISTP